jgi:hypothetical protein
MLEFVFMMLLVASFIAIGGASYHQMEVDKAQAQAQAQQPLQQPGQIQVQPKSPITKGLVTPAQKRFETASQALADKQLLDRLFPQIIKRMDGKTLAAKVLPYLDLKMVVTERPGQTNTVKVGNLAHNFGIPKVSARCAPGEIVVSGGFENRLSPGTEVRDLYSRKSSPTENQWTVSSIFYGDGQLLSFADCLNVELTLKDIQQPQQQPQPPSQPPGGPPLQPPPNLR